MTLNLNRSHLADTSLNVTTKSLIEYASRAKHADDKPRDHLGASLIGDECVRKIQFDWQTGASFSARVHSIFARGHYFEYESREQLIDAGFLFETNPEKLGFVIADGLIAGHIDGLILEVPPGVDLKPPAVWEHKALNDKNYRAVERDGIAKVFPRYAAQIAVYQNFLDVLNPALVTICNADNCERLHFAVPFDARLVQEAVNRAVTVIVATRAGELLPRLDQTLDDFRCYWCPHRKRCKRYE